MLGPVLTSLMYEDKAQLKDVVRTLDVGATRLCKKSFSYFILLKKKKKKKKKKKMKKKFLILRP